MSRLTLLALVAGAALAQACKNDSGTDPGEPVAHVEVSPAAPIIPVGGNIRLTVTLRDRHDRILTGRTVTWSTEPTIVLTVSAAGLVTAHAVGSAAVTATSEGKQGRVTVSVVGQAVPVASVSLDRTAVDLLEGDETRLIATPRDADGHPLEGRAVQWTSSDGAIASVTAGGDVTAIRVGATEIAATVEGKSATAAVRVDHHYGFALVYNDWAHGFPTRLITARLGAEGEPLLPPDILAGWALSQAKQSPDRQHIVFQGNADYYSAVFVINADGTGLRELAAGEQPTWSPDGTRIAYVVWPWDGDADVWIINLDGTGAANLTDDLGDTDQHEPAWSPELPGGSRIAFSHGDPTASTIWTMRPDGTDRRQVTTGAAVHDGHPAWSPEGAALVFTRWEGPVADSDLWVVSANGANPTGLLRLPGWQSTPAWSPDGRLIAFASGHEEPDAHKIYTVWSDGTKLARRTDGAGWHGNPSWRIYAQ